MLQAITVKYLGPTNTHGTRLKALAAAGSVTIHRDYSVDPAVDERRAAVALIRKLGWDPCTIQGGRVKSGEVVFVLSYGDAYAVTADGEGE